MQVTIDGRALVGNRTGIGVHTAEIARRLVDSPLIASHTQILDRSGLERCRFRVDPMPLGVAWQQFVLPRIATEGVLWAPHGTLPVALRIPSVATIHDFSSLTMPLRHRVKTMLSFNVFIGRSLQMASRIAAVSRAVAEEAVRWFGVARQRIEIVPNGVDEYFAPEGEEEDYVLYVGTIEPRKGLDDLLAVWDSLPASRPRLVVCGAAGWGDVRLPDGAELTGYVDRARLRELYRHARAFVYPSRYEGFGIPPLEAMACGAPVIATRTGAIPEYAEGAALLIDPGDRVALHEGLVRLLRDAPLRRELRARGAERARTYTWDRSAALMTTLLAEACR
ncbi:MAG TPA: glycosyltransferase family 1 protein [Thermoanaerobaculia bacterium]|jgi:glycosyltransferase involved in cell wall biosynthesis|nr:glycosyltransferase family 1 protein [Thermoanaerobaculia bacterium]